MFEHRRGTSLRPLLQLVSNLATQQQREVGRESEEDKDDCEMEQQRKREMELVGVQLQSVLSVANSIL